MKKMAFIVLLLGVVFVFGQSSQQNRFEELQSQKNPDSFIPYMTAWHDKESGAEFICVRGEATGGVQQNYSISCFLTGRNWK